MYMQTVHRCQSTLSLRFKSAPWLFRTLTTSRLPPLQAQCTALDSSWKNSTYEYKDLSALTSVSYVSRFFLYWHQCLAWSLKLTFAPFFRRLWTTVVCPSIDARCNAVLFNCHIFTQQMMYSKDVYHDTHSSSFTASRTSSWTFGLPPSARYSSTTSSLPWAAAVMKAAASTLFICHWRHRESEN